MQPTPWLATEWEISEDSKQFTFTLAEGVKWHDGQPLTAEDVKFSLEYYRDNVPGAAWMKDIIDTVETSGNDVIEILEKLNGSGMTLIMVTHDPALGGRADRQIHMVDGKIESDMRAS